jgi:type IV pilus assembly protein PilV
MVGFTSASFPAAVSSNGFTLIEVLVALSLLAAGVLSLSALQQQVLTRNFAALSESRAWFLLQDLAERMRASGGGGAYLLAYEAAAPVATVDCTQQHCDANAMARWDLAEWRSRVADAAYLPAGEGQVSGDAASGLYSVSIRYGAARHELTLRVGLPP